MSLITVDKGDSRFKDILPHLFFTIDFYDIRNKMFLYTLNMDLCVEKPSFYYLQSIAQT